MIAVNQMVKEEGKEGGDWLMAVMCNQVLFRPTLSCKLEQVKCSLRQREISGGIMEKRIGRDIEKGEKKFSMAVKKNQSAANIRQAAKYLHLMEIDGDQVLSRQYLLDIANQLASNRQSRAAARAYEQFLAHYGGYEYVEQVMLMVGIIYARYLEEPGKAIQYLRKAEQRLTDAQQLRMCREELARLED